MTSELTPTEAAYETGFANGYDPKTAVPEFGTLAETQSWEDGYGAGRQARLDDGAHRARLDAQGF